MKKILFAAGEALPFIKTGGLADVIGSLPKILAKRGYDVRVVIPLYQKVAQKYFEMLEKECVFDVNYGCINTIATIYSCEIDSVKYYFVQHQGYFERDGLYGYPDDGERFGYFQRVVLDMLTKVNFKPDVIHCHDWHTGMIPFLGKTQYRLKSTSYVFTIHNLAYQGFFHKDVLFSCLGVNYDYFNNGQLKFNDGINFVKAGIVFADKVSTVSNTYAHEILTSQYGEKLEDILNMRRNDLWGIVNGIDTVAWDSVTDPYIIQNYNLKTVSKGKLANKKALQERLGLRVAGDVMVIGMVSRLTWQKGVYLMIEKLQQIMGNDIQLVILGTGENYVESQFKKMEYDYRRRAVYYCGYNEELAHLIYAGSDVFMMPSLFEPCGISQLISMRYGTLPLVRETGGLKDTVTPYNQYTKEGNGFSFQSYNSDELLHVINMAVDLYYLNNKDFKQLVKNAMNTDVSWEQSCDLYEKMYKEIS
ncbi:MAG: glycogen synthase GlgA [Erysipelotrichaceae bacterium]